MKTLKKVKYQWWTVFVYHFFLGFSIVLAYMSNFSFTDCMITAVWLAACALSIHNYRTVKRMQMAGIDDEEDDV